MDVTNIVLKYLLKYVLKYSPIMDAKHMEYMECKCKYSPIMDVTNIHTWNMDANNTYDYDMLCYDTLLYRMFRCVTT